MNAHRTHPSRLRAALAARRARGSAAFAGGAPSDPGGGAPSRRARLAFAAAGLSSLAAAALFVSLASASIGHVFKDTLGASAQPTIAEFRALTVDPSSGDVFVMEAGSSPSIERYRPNGTAASFSALGTNVIDGAKGTGGNACTTEPSSCDETPQNGLTFPSASEAQLAIAPAGSAGGTAGDIYVVTRSPKSVTIFKPTGEYAGQLTAAGSTNFTEPCGVGVDSGGAVYVGDYGHGVEKFVPSANPITSSDNTATFNSAGTSTCKVAADAGSSAGSIFVARYNGELFKLNSSSGADDYEVSSGSTMTASVDPTSGHVYVATGSEVREYDAASATSATLVSSIAPGSSVEGVAANSTEDVYLYRSGQSHIEVYGPATTVYKLTVTTSGNGSGTITSSPAGVNCGSTCEAQFEGGTHVTLTAATSPGSTFSGWTGCAAEPSPTECEVAMSADHTVEASFTAPERPFLFAFDGHETTAGVFLSGAAFNDLAVDNATGTVYAVVTPNQYQGALPIDKFNAEGQAEDFSASVGSSLFLNKATPGALAVDNSGGSSQGRLLFFSSPWEWNKPWEFFALDPTGTRLWSVHFSNEESASDVAVDHGGHPWYLEQSSWRGPRAAIQYEPNGNPPAPTGCTIPGPPGALIDFDAAGNAYVRKGWYGPIVKFIKSGACTYTESSSALDSNAEAFYVDQSNPSGHIFTAQTGNFEEYDSTGAHLGTFGAHYLSLWGERIAYSPTKNWVYVTQGNERHPVVAVFGPPTTGTAPEVTATSASLTGTEVSTAHLSGEVNPQNVPTQAHFEWKKSEESWASAALHQSSPLQALTTNNTPQTVTFNTDTLRGNTTYEVRLVGVNSSNHLAGFSSDPVTITTKRATEPPEATISPVTTFGITTATVDGTVNPKGDTAEWRVELQKACAGEFHAERLESLAHAATTPQTVSYDLSGLIPSERYCARLWAENSAVGPEIQQLVVDAGTGEYTLGFEGETTIPIPYNASAGQVQNRLEQLASISWRIHVSGGPGAVGGGTPYLIEFRYFQDKDVPPLECLSINLSGGASTCTATTIHQGTTPTQSTPPAEFTTAAIPPAVAETSFAAPRLDTSARLNGRVNPEGEVVTYRFQYSEDGGSTWKPVEGCENGAGAPTAECTYSGEEREQVVVREELTGLKPNTTYSYRFFAENPADAGHPLEGAVETFTTRTSAETTLPATRGTELVNPPNKGNQNILPEGQGYHPVGPSSPDGNRIFWTLSGGAPGANTASGDIFLSRRTGQSEAAPNGWETKSLIPPPAQQQGGGNYHYTLLGATPDLGRFFFMTGRWSILSGFQYGTSLARIRAGGGEEVLASEAHGSRAAGIAEVSEDGNHFVKPDENYQLVDHEAPGEQTVLNVMPDGIESACPVEAPLDWPGSGAVNGGFDIAWRPGYSLIDRVDASRVYFQMRPSGECGKQIGEPTGVAALYERNREANGGAGQTYLVDAGSAHEPLPIRASADGRQFYYITETTCRRWQYNPSGPATCLEQEANDHNENLDVYRWNEEAGTEGESECLTCQVKDEAGETIEDVDITPVSAAGPGTAVIVSDDFSHIYFTSGKQLIPGRGEPNGGNLYVLNGGVLRFVAPIGGNALKPSNAETSANGNALLFSTLEAGVQARQLTADEVGNGGGEWCPSLDEKGKTSKCIELYRYEDAARSIECISCLRGGDTTQSFRGTSVNRLGGETGSAIDGFVLSRDGSTVAFTTAQQLVPEDVNNGRDVYEWRNGVLRLITDGITQFAEGPSAPVVTAITPDGSNIFFAVADPGLTGFEHDEMRNLYDTRIGGGFPVPNPPAHCSEESCQGPLQPAPALDQSGSALVNGHGNLPSNKHCAKGTVRRHGRCVKKRHNHRSRHDRRARANRRPAR